ncbi:MAG: glycoside hydrolase family 3 C-terminal domain-containing protein [Ruminococcus sp.]|nr:glycoside hydrolase family 3 C-terminal domain-containing protein [Ruminococcus sp.]
MKKYLDESLSARERAKALVNEMTIEECASRLRYDSPSVERLRLDAYNWWNEGLHGLARAGTATMFSQCIALAAMFDSELVERVGEVIAQEARAKYNAAKSFGDFDIYKGLTLWNPNVNIFRDPRWGRGQETYGEDPFLTAENGKAMVRGLQGDGEVLKAAACVKHFAVHSGPENLRHEFDAKVSAKDLEETYLYAFEEVVKAGAEGVMGAYNRVNGEAACASEFLQKKLTEWGFDGYFVSDCWAVRDLHEHHGLTSNSVESAALALKNGCDINCGCSYVNLLAALEQGLVSEDDIRKACVNAMTTLVKLGILDEETPYDNIPYSVVCSDEHKALALECAEKSMVLLENNGILPLDESRLKTIAVVGPNADSRTALEGNYCGRADRYVTFLEGIEDRFSGRVLYSEGCHLYKDRMSALAMVGDRLSEAYAAAKSSDVVILCVGLDSTIEGEEGDTGNEFSSGDKESLRLPESQRKLIETVKKAGKPVIVVCASGSSINIESDCDALIQAWYSGESGGRALAEILFGDISPSGKLPVTFYKSADKLPDFTDYSMKNRTYRYTRENILYPFGYGLTYSKAQCRELEFSDGEASVKVCNVGSFDTDEVVQIYLKSHDKNAPPYPTLCGFKRVSLKAGEEKEIKIDIPKKAFTTVDESGRREIFSEKFTLYASTQQPFEEFGDGFLKMTITM